MWPFLKFFQTITKHIFWHFAHYYDNIIHLVSHELVVFMNQSLETQFQRSVHHFLRLKLLWVAWNMKQLLENWTKLHFRRVVILTRIDLFAMILIQVFLDNEMLLQRDAKTTWQIMTLSRSLLVPSSSSTTRLLVVTPFFMTWSIFAQKNFASLSFQEEKTNHCNRESDSFYGPDILLVVL